MQSNPIGNPISHPISNPIQNPLYFFTKKMKNLDRDPPNARNPTNVSKAVPEAAKINAKSPKDVPKVPKRHPKGDQKA